MLLKQSNKLKTEVLLESICCSRFQREKKETLLFINYIMC